MKKLLTSAAFALALFAGEVSAQQIYVNFGPRFGPPPAPREFYGRCPSPHHVWVPGFYTFDRGRYFWNSGYWAAPPRGRSHWRPGKWDRRHRGGDYVWVNGYWR